VGPSGKQSLISNGGGFVFWGAGFALKGDCRLGLNGLTGVNQPLIPWK